MARKTLTERRADKLAQLDSLKQEIAKMEELAAKRIGKGLALHRQVLLTQAYP